MVGERMTEDETVHDRRMARLVRRKDLLRARRTP